MVKEFGGRGREGRRDIIWSTRELEYRSGLPVSEIARRHGVSERTVRDWVSRRKWTVQLGTTEHVARRLTVEIARAERALVDGEIGDAERRVRAASALARATRVLVQLERAGSSERNEGGDGRTLMDEEDEGFEDVKAELHRRLLRIIESAESKGASGAMAGSDQCGGGSLST